MLVALLRQAVPASRFGGALGAVMMIAWAGMAAGGYSGGLPFDLSRSYTVSLVLAGLAGLLNLAVIATIAAMKTLGQSRKCGA